MFPTSWATPGWGGKGGGGGRTTPVGCFCGSLASSLALEAPGPYYSAFTSSKGAELALECKRPLLQHQADSRGALELPSLQTRRAQ